ncbi:unnamed protein product [Adineta ricciae]|uniref:E3 ubiquitin-protein ligase n=1 Tax=Adineta ricciae TaxID=249248 RepID=A0A814TVB9_ADIRI|nr:unnamed protein product [Adineta ricciae]
MDPSVSLPSPVFFYEYCMHNPSRAQRILNEIFDPHVSLRETITKHLTRIKSYISGQQTFDDFCRKMQKCNNSVLCGRVWIHPTISYRCRTCAINPSMSLCPDCFYAGNHAEHDVNMFRSLGGGVCDCGDETVMKCDGFCKQHGPNRISDGQVLVKYIRSAQIVLPRLITRFVQHLRSHASPTQSNLYVTIDEFDSLSPLFDLLDDLCDTGSTIRSIFTHCLLDTEMYKQLNEQSPLSDLRNITHDVYLQQLKETSNLSVPLLLQTDEFPESFVTQQAGCLLGEMLFWLMKYQISERLLKFSLMLLTESDFKDVFTQSFLNVYGIAIAQMIKTRNSREKMNLSRLVHISVQLFSNTHLTTRAIENYHLMEIILSSLHALFDRVKTSCQLQNRNTNCHFVIFEDDFSRSMHYWPMISDFMNILSHEHASRQLITKENFLLTWISIINGFQGMNVNHQKPEFDILHQSNTNYLFAFTIEIECCATALWTIIAHIMTPDFLNVTSVAINYLLITIKEWLSAIELKHHFDIRQDQITYHLPLHRYLSILSYVSLNYQDGLLNDLFSAESAAFLHCLAIFSLRIQVIVATLVNVNTFNEMIFKSFHVSDWLLQRPDINLAFDKSAYVTLLQGSLIVFASIIVFTPHIGSIYTNPSFCCIVNISGLDDFECRRTELIHALVLQDCLYSYLDEHIAEPKGLGGGKLDIQSILDDIAEYVPPTIDIVNGSKQGQYRLKGEL